MLREGRGQVEALSTVHLHSLEDDAVYAANKEHPALTRQAAIHRGLEVYRIGTHPDDRFFPAVEPRFAAGLLVDVRRFLSSLACWIIWSHSWFDTSRSSRSCHAAGVCEYKRTTVALTHSRQRAELLAWGQKSTYFHLNLKLPTSSPYGASKLSDCL